MTRILKPVLPLMLLGASLLNAQEVRIASHVSALAPLYYQGKNFSDEVNSKVKKAYDFKLYPSAQLGKEKALITNLKAGSLEMIVVVSGVLKLDKKLGIFDLPWLFNDRAHVQNGVVSILENKTLISTIEDISGIEKESVEDDIKKETLSFRDKFEAKHRATDGHYTRSKAEMLIDNWLYMFEIVHAYERRLPIEEEVYSDFYIPAGKVYIEYWGYENDEKYLHRKKIKQDIYKKYNLNLIELEDKDVQNLDNVLPKYLLKYGIQTY